MAVSLITSPRVFTNFPPKINLSSKSRKIPVLLLVQFEFLVALFVMVGKIVSTGQMETLGYELTKRMAANTLYTLFLWSTCMDLQHIEHYVILWI